MSPYCVPGSNIVAFFGCCWSLDSVEVGVVLEYCSRGTLMAVLSDTFAANRLTWSAHKLGIAQGIARGLAHLPLELLRKIVDKIPPLPEPTRDEVNELHRLSTLRMFRGRVVAITTATP